MHTALAIVAGLLLAAAGIVHPDGMAQVPDWSPEAALDAMDALGIATACLSISSPGVRFSGGAGAAELARRCNDYAAELVRAHPDRFRFFAVTPLPDVDASLVEIERALDTLGASGVVFETNFEGVYLGDALLEPVYRELDRRDATLFIHPTSPNCRCGRWSPEGERASDIALGYPRPMLEFMFETTRTVAHMILSGMLERHPRVRVLVPHAGGCLPVLTSRVELLQSAGADPAPPRDVRAGLRRLHYDLAGAPVPEALAAVLSVADPERLHYGSDWPFTPVRACRSLLEALRSTALLADDRREAMFVGNSAALLGADGRRSDGTPQTPTE